MTDQLIERVMRRVEFDTNGGCWLWTGTLSRGHGQIVHEGCSVPVHRALYEALRAPVPKELTMDHLCRVRCCVNPDHLEPVTNRENLRRGYSPSAVHGRKTHCDHGHLFTPENTYLYKGWRYCRTCIADYKREHKARGAALDRERHRRNRERLQQESRRG